MHKLLNEISLRLTTDNSIYDKSIKLLFSYNLTETADHVRNVATLAM
jgi:hypothetical protein